MAKHYFILCQMSKCTLKEKPKIVASENWKVCRSYRLANNLRSAFSLLRFDSLIICTEQDDNIKTMRNVSLPSYKTIHLCQ